MDKAQFSNIVFTSEFYGFTDDEFSINTDKMRLKQVVLNLQSNALKFCKPGGSVTIVCLNKLPFVEVQVIDTGYGIKEEDLPKLFQLFGYLNQTSDRNTNGIGLGLYITKQIVEEFGGKVSVRSVFGEGTTFTLSFKLSSAL